MQKDKIKLIKRVGTPMIIIIFTYIFFKYLFSTCLPFIAAALFSIPVKRLTDIICKGNGSNRRMICAIVLVLLLSLFGTGVYFGLRAGIVQLLALGSRLTLEPDGLTEMFSRAGERLSNILSEFGLDGVSQALDGTGSGWISELIGRGVMSICEAVYPAIVGFASGIPSRLLSMCVFLLSSYYFSLDGKGIFQGVSSLFSERAGKKALQIKGRVLGAAGRFFSAHLMLCLITFLTVLLGLCVIGCEYSLVIAAAVAVVDLLPVLGTGAVLVPWSIVCFLLGRSFFGWGLLVIYAATLIIHQLLEPKLIGKSLGIHPLLSLAATYFGYRALGVSGIIAGPMIAYVLCVYVHLDDH